LIAKAKQLLLIAGLITIASAILGLAMGAMVFYLIKEQAKCTGNKRRLPDGV
jgi:hypothetical protein